MTIRTFISLIFIFLFGCNRLNLTTENRAYIGYVDSSLAGHNTEITDLDNKQFFSKAFWDYFIRKFPQSTAIMFYSNDFNIESRIQLKDTSFLISELDYPILWKLRNNLPATADGSEKKDNFLPTPFFEYDNNDGKSNIVDTIEVPKLSEPVMKEYKLFLKAIKDSKMPPVFVFTKDFQKDITTLYKKKISS